MHFITQFTKAMFLQLQKHLGYTTLLLLYLIPPALTAQGTAANSDNLFLADYHKAQVQYSAGHYQPAINLFKKSRDGAKGKDDLIYLNSIYYLARCHNRNSDYGLCELVNLIGIEESRRIATDKPMESYFILSEGINYCSIGKYALALQKLTTALPKIAKVSDFAGEQTANFYIGKCYWMLDQKKKAVPYLDRVDKIFSARHHINPELREAYEMLIDYTNENNEAESQLHYLKQLPRADQSIGLHYPNLLDATNKTYTATKIKERQQEVEKNIFLRKTLNIVILILMAFVGYAAFRSYFRKSGTNVKAASADSSNPGIHTGTTENASDISTGSEAAILKNLEQFELGKKYLEKDMTIARMSTLLQTNPKYVTKIVARHRNKRTIDYIIDLKLDHILHLLETEPKYRYYTNKALAEEAGFGSAQHFAKSFKAKTGESPTDFIGRLDAGELN
jgi:AraC-like DNA-binding protein